MPTTRSHQRWSRRQFVGTGVAAAGATLAPGLARAQGGHWTQRPPGNPGSVTFVVWQYGKIYEQIARQFEDDWGVKVNQIIEPNVEPQVAKLTTMFAAGDAVDVSQSPMQYLASLHRPGHRPAHRRAAGRGAVRARLHAVHPGHRAARRQDVGAAVLLHRVDVHVQRRAARQAGFKDKPFRS